MEKKEITGHSAQSSAMLWRGTMEKNHSQERDPRATQGDREVQIIAHMESHMGKMQDRLTRYK